MLQFQAMTRKPGPLVKICRFSSVR